MHFYTEEESNIECAIDIDLPSRTSSDRYSQFILKKKKEKKRKEKRLIHIP